MPDLRTADVLRTTGAFAIFEGVLFILGGILLVIAPFAAVEAFTQITGVLLLLGGIIGIIRATSHPRDQHASSAGVLGPVLACLAGAVLLIDPTLAATFLITMLGAMLLISGGMQIAAACGSHGRDGWIMFLISGVATVVLGAVVFLMPGIAIFVFAIFAGVQLFFVGVMMIRGGSEFRRISRAA